MNAMPIATAMPLLVFATIGVILLLRRKMVKTAPFAPEVAADGAMIVPIRGLYLRRGGIMGGMTHNNINPRFAITPDGIRFRVFADSWLPFSDIEHVEVRERFGFVYLLLVNSAGPRLLSVNVGNREIAKHVLDALPRGVALTPEAATLRDGSAVSGTSGLRLYGGRFV